ncbi:MAG: hypothetical protein JWQ56_1142 [Pseudarthrobacter sp.]|nr:hypothetical protein [Pseudarthrobacter sp.]
MNVVRWDWADLMETGTLERKLAAAGVSRRRTRSAVTDAQTRRCAAQASEPSAAPFPCRIVQAYDEHLAAPHAGKEAADIRADTRRETDTMAETPNPIQIQKFLGGVDYPASREALLSKAKDSGADSNVIQALEAIPDREYDSPTAVSSAVSDNNS